MFCKNCGSVLNDDAKFCYKCGIKVDSVNADFVPSYVDNTASASNPAPVTEPTENASVSDYTQVPSGEVSFSNSNAMGEQPVYTTVPPAAYNMPANQNTKDKGGFAVASLVLGIVSYVACCVGPITQILAVIFGIIGIKSSKKGLAIAGIILGALGIVLSIVIFILSFISGLTSDASEFSDIFGVGLYY